MGGWIVALDHPYAAVTDGKGRFTIRNAPAGATLELVAWHEAGKFGQFSKSKPIPMTIPAGGSVERNLTLRAD